MTISNAVDNVLEQVVHQAVVPQTSLPDALLHACSGKPAAAIHFLQKSLIKISPSNRKYVSHEFKEHQMALGENGKTPFLRASFSTSVKSPAHAQHLWGGQDPASGCLDVQRQRMNVNGRPERYRCSHRQVVEFICVGHGLVR